MKNKVFRRTLAGVGMTAALLLGTTGCAGQVPALQEGAETTETEPSVAGAEEAAGDQENEMILPIQAKNGMWGYVDMDGNMAIFPQYDEAEAFTSDGVAYVRMGNQIGYIDRSGSWVVGPKTRGEYFDFGKVEKLLVNEAAIAKAGLDKLPPQDFEICGSWGSVGMDGKVIIPFRYDILMLCDSGLYVAGYDKDGDGETEYGLLDQDGQELAPFEYDYISSDQSCGLFLFEKKDLYGYLNQNGKEVIEAKYSNADYFSSYSGCAIVAKGGYYGLIDQNGEELVPAVYEYCSSPLYVRGETDSAMMKVEPDRDMGDSIYYFYTEDDEIEIYNASNQSFLPEKYDDINSDIINGNFIIVGRNEKYGAINSNGEVLLKLVYDSLYHPSADGLVIANKSGKWGMLDSNGETVIPFKYDSLWNSNEFGQVEAELNGKTGSLNKKGQTVIPFAYDYLEWFGEDELGPVLFAGTEKLSESGTAGLIAATDDERTVVYDADGKELWEYKETDFAIEDMSEEQLMEASLSVIQEFLDLLGYDGQVTMEDVVDFYVNQNYGNYDDSEQQAAKIHFDYESGRYGLKDVAGNVLIEPVYTDIYAMDGEGMYWIEEYDEEKEGSTLGAVYVENGQAYVIEPEYDSVYGSGEGIIHAVKDKTSILLNKYGEWIMKAN